MVKILSHMTYIFRQMIIITGQIKLGYRNSMEGFLKIFQESEQNSQSSAHSGNMIVMLIKIQG